MTALKEETVCLSVLLRAAWFAKVGQCLSSLFVRRAANGCVTPLGISIVPGADSAFVKITAGRSWSFVGRPSNPFPFHGGATCWY